MPTSPMCNVSPIMAEVERLGPESVLDLGIGRGKYGVLVREVLPDVTLHGVDAWEGNRCAGWGDYDSVVVGDYSMSPYPADRDLVLWPRGIVVRL